MLEESSPLLSLAEESIGAETDAALELEPEGDEPTPEPASEPACVCDSDEQMHSACTGLPFYKEHEGKRYCVLHYPGKEKSADFTAAFNSKVNNKDFDFRGVWFPNEVRFSFSEVNADTNFSSATFSGDAHFLSATFNGAVDFSSATFCGAANFLHATFNGTADFSSATFCRTANFDSATFSADADFRRAMFGAEAQFNAATFNASADFDSTEFSAAEFWSATFNAEASFTSATFNSRATFTSAEFSATAFFSLATFSAAADFSGAIFSADAYFRSCNFSAVADFVFVTFSAAAYFRSAKFSAPADFAFSVFHSCTEFSGASFNDSIHFFGYAIESQLKGRTVTARAFGKDTWLDLQHLRIGHSDRIAFHTLNLRPHWFINVDSRQFVFTDVGWQLDRISIKEGIAALEAKWVSSPNRLLAIACRQLAENAETNNRYEEASSFRYWAMDLARRTKWKGRTFLKTDWLHMLYWAVSGYGERILRALGVLAAVWMLFVMLYTRVGFVQQPPSNQAASSATATSMTIEDRIGRPLELSRAVTYSLAVMSLQKPEPKPLTGTAQTLVLLETILGPLQAALLALAIRRKFMR